MFLEISQLSRKSETTSDLDESLLKYIDQITFLSKNSYLFRRKNVLELGCGSGYIKNLNFLEIADYTGIDNDISSNADYIGNFEDPNIYEKTQKSPFDIIVAFNQIPQNLMLLHENLKDDGIFFHSSSPFWYEINKIEKRISDYFTILDKSLEKFYVTDINLNEELPLDSYFLTCKKKHILPYN